MPLIIPGNSQASTGYTIDQSIRFNSSSNPALSKTFSGAGTNKTWTFSCWFKRGGKEETRNMIFSAGSAGNSFGGLELGHGAGTSYGRAPLIFYNYTGGGYDWRLQTSMAFADFSAWYHVTVVCDTTTALPSERARIYINGVRITDFSSSISAPSFPSLDFAGNHWMGTTEHDIGTSIYTTQNFDGYLAEIHNIDGQALDCNSFGEFNDSGIWIPKEYSGSYGTNGFKIDGRDSSDLGDDESGNGNDFTSSNLAASDQVSDSPTNNWCVMNPLNGDGGTTWKNGNLELATVNSGNNASTIFMTTGKWYWEVKGQGYAGAVCSIDKGAYNSGITPSDSGSIGYYSTGDFYWAGGSDSTPASYASSDIIGVAVNMDDGNISFYKNNTLQGTLSFSSTVSSLATDGCYACVNNGTSSSSITFYLNFGQDGTFAGTETAQGNSDGNGVGNFYYTPPTGYLALCTKNLGS